MARQEGKDESSKELEVNVYDSFPQDWLNAEDLEEQVARNLPQTIAKIPSFLEGEVKSKRVKSCWLKQELLRKAFVSSSAFLLGVVCTLGGSSFFDRSTPQQEQIAEETVGAEIQGTDELDLSNESVVQFSSTQSFENSTSSDGFNNSRDFEDLSANASLNSQYDELYASRPANFNSNGPSTSNEYAAPQTFDNGSTVGESEFPTWADLAPREEALNSQVATTSQELNVSSGPQPEQGALQERFNASQTLPTSVQAQGNVVFQPDSAQPQFQAFSTGQPLPDQSDPADYNEKNNYVNVSSSKILTSETNYVDVSQRNVYDRYQGNSGGFRQDLGTSQVATTPASSVEPEYEARNNAPLYQDRWSQNVQTSEQDPNVPQVSEFAPLYSEVIPTFDNPHPEVQNGGNRQAYVAQHYEESSQQTSQPATKRALRW